MKILPIWRKCVSKKHTSKHLFSLKEREKESNNKNKPTSLKPQKKLLWWWVQRVIYDDVIYHLNSILSEKKRLLLASSRSHLNAIGYILPRFSVFCLCLFLLKKGETAKKYCVLSESQVNLGKREAQTAKKGTVRQVQQFLWGIGSGHMSRQVLSAHYMQWLTHMPRAEMDRIPWSAISNQAAMHERAHAGPRVGTRVADSVRTHTTRKCQRCFS